MTSFKRSLYSHHYRPSHYRTPSPPVQSEIELLSPVPFKDSHANNPQPRNGFISDGGERRSVPPQKRTWEESSRVYSEEFGAEFQSLNNDRDKRHKSLGSLPGTSAMDAFATIALAMSGSAQYPMNDLAGLNDQFFGQVKPQSPDAYSTTRPALGPAGGYMPADQPVKIRAYASPIYIPTERNPLTTSALSVTSTDDAELLLNVSRAVVLSPTTSRPSFTQPAPLAINGEGHASRHASQIPPPVSHESPDVAMGQSDSLATLSEENHSGRGSCHNQSESTTRSDKPIGTDHYSDDSSYEQLSTNTSMNVSQGSPKRSECEPCVSSNAVFKSIEADNNSELGSHNEDNTVTESRSHPEAISFQHTVEVTTSVTQQRSILDVRRSDDQAGLTGDQVEAKSHTAHNQSHDSLDTKDINASALSSANVNHLNPSTSGEAPLPERALIRRDDSHLGSVHDKGSPSTLYGMHSRDDSQLLRASSSILKPRRGSAPEVFSGESTRTRTLSQERERRVDKKSVPEQSTTTGPLENIINPPVHPPSEMGSQVNGQKATCKGCRTLPNGTGVPPDDEEGSWIRCDGCKQWFHFACAGLTAKEVRGVDKFSCRDCWDSHGPTTYVRKSGRTHTAIDYARLNEGVVKISDENPNHPYIKPIKKRTIQFLPDNFPRVAPELITAEFFEKGNGMKEPTIISASMNPQRKSISDGEDHWTVGSHSMDSAEPPLPDSQGDVDTHMTHDYEYDHSPDYGQDKLDMVIPQGLTVRQVAELYGPHEKVDVIDVKSQESASWNLKKWADYYESKSKKQIKNVISLEVSSSKLGRLIKRPKVVRQLDLADSVWPPDLKAKGDFPKVQLYCLMSVADSFTDFHIDFGGSSVFYHILKGKKTFLFIPPKSKNLKKYEQWCQSPVQQQTFLADQTKECYRVDLSAGDTMLIPSGWIHAVWTPEDSLVIGGNFLTRMHYGMQIQIAEIEKNTKVAMKFRYPHFQKVLWLTAIKYLKDDPLPSMVEKSLQEGETFVREIPSYHEFDEWGPSSKPGPENYQARYYSQHELDGLSDLVRYLFRTALVATGKVVDGITADTRLRVGRSIPKGHGDPLEVVKRFAMWCAWKRGNEHIPAWAYANATTIDDMAKAGEKKLSAAAIKRLEREAAAEARRVVPRRQSQRKRGKGSTGTAQVLTMESNITSFEDSVKNQVQKAPVVLDSNNMVPEVKFNPRKRDASTADLEEHSIDKAKKATGAILTNGLASNSDSLILSPAKGSCLACQKRGIECEHQVTDANGGGSVESSKRIIPSEETSDIQVDQMVGVGSSISSNLFTHSSLQLEAESQITALSHTDLSGPSAATQTNNGETLQETESARLPDSSAATLNSSQPSTSSGHSKRIRNACQDCRRSKRRCVHNEDGIADPIKVKEAASKRSEYNLKRRLQAKEDSESSSNKRQKVTVGSIQDGDTNHEGHLFEEQVSTPLANGILNGGSDEREDASEMDVSASQTSIATQHTGEAKTSISRDSSFAELVEAVNETEWPKGGSHDSIINGTEVALPLKSGITNSSDVQNITEGPPAQDLTKDIHTEQSTIPNPTSTEQGAIPSSTKPDVSQTVQAGEYAPGIQSSQDGKEDILEKRRLQEEINEESAFQLQVIPFTLNHYIEPRSPTPEPLSQPSSPLSELVQIPSSPIPRQVSTQQAVTTSSQSQIQCVPMQAQREQERNPNAKQEKTHHGRRHSSRPRKQPEFFAPPAPSNPQPRSSTTPNPTHKSSSSPTKSRPSSSTTMIGEKNTTSSATFTAEKSKKRKIHPRTSTSAGATAEQAQPPKKKAKVNHKHSSSNKQVAKVQHVKDEDDENEKETMKLVREMAFGLRRR